MLYRKIGGLHFLFIGRLTLSWSWRNSLKAQSAMFNATHGA